MSNANPGTTAKVVGNPFSALGDPNRRAILELLGAGGRSVRQIADALPISRPAVSRHLRLLKDAGLVVEEPMGTRRIYRLHDEGVQAVQVYLEQVWGDAAARFRLIADNTTTRGEPAMIEPLRLAFDVDCPPERAFEVWTAEIARWWPTSHTVSCEPGLRVILEPRVGGRIYERTPSGDEFDWGEVTAWEPPALLAYAWHLRTDRADATDVRITFVHRGRGATHVQIEHDGWERLGAGGPARREANMAGWDGLVPHYTAACGRDGDG